MYVNDTNSILTNFEHIFDLTSERGGDPGPGSIFNITTLQFLLNISASQPDIILNPEKPKTSMDLSAYKPVTKMLGFQTNE